MLSRFIYNRGSLTSHEKHATLQHRGAETSKRFQSKEKSKDEHTSSATTSTTGGSGSSCTTTNLTTTVTLNLQGEHRLLHQLLREFHSFTREQCAKLREEGYSSLSDLVNWKFKDIRSLLENLSNRGDRNFKLCPGT